MSSTTIPLDVKLLEWDGIEVVKHTIENPMAHQQPIIILGFSKEESDIASCYDFGANGYIRNLIDFNRFIKIIRYLLMYWLGLNDMASAGSRRFL